MLQVERERRQSGMILTQQEEEAALREATQPMTVADAAKRVLLAWKDKDLLRQTRDACMAETDRLLQSFLAD